ncbi:MAG TPA: hypothetical protein VFY35_02500 [Burkholderiaceae bacterium]|nr:hypothetical protein [Burkholderiaceae bacterium]
MTSDLPPASLDAHALWMDLAKTRASRLRREAIRDFDFGAAALARSARRLHASLKRHAALRARAQAATPSR